MTALPPRHPSSPQSAPAPHGTDGHGTEQASAWVRRWTHLVAPGGTVLDVACGRGRHARWFHANGNTLTVVDRSSDALAAIDLPNDQCEKVAADMESGPWPFTGRQFDAVLVTNYLWRPLLATLLASLTQDGVLLYETFAAGNETLGKPSRPDFLLQPGELLSVCASLRVVAFEDGYEPGSQAGGPRFVQRIAAVNTHRNDPERQRFALR